MHRNPALCAGVKVDKGLKVTDTRPGQWVLVSGIGGLGHVAVQYAVAMGLRIVAVDVEDSNEIFAEMEAGRIDGRVVMAMNG